MSAAFNEGASATLRQHFSNLQPTTYEVSKAYLDGELLEPKGQRDLRRELCILCAVTLPKDRGIYFKADATKTLIELSKGDILVWIHPLGFATACAQWSISGCFVFYPTVELLPTTFGTPENPQSDQLWNVWDGETSGPTTATVIMAYFTRVGSTLGYIGDMTNAV